MSSSRTFHFRHALIGEEWMAGVRVWVDASGRISQVRCEPPSAEDTVLDVVVPGMVNLHSHAFQRLMAGTAEFRDQREDSFWTWREAMYAEAVRLTPERMHLAARWVFQEMLERGYTCVGEFHYVHHDADGRPYAPMSALSQAVVQAAQEVGIRCTHLPTLYGFGGFEKEPLRGGQRRFGNDADAVLTIAEELLARRDPPTIKIGMAAHSLRAVSPEALTELVQGWFGGSPRAERSSAGETERRAHRLHIHIAEQTAEVERCQAVRQARPVDWLLDQQPVDARWCLVHATHVKHRELVAMADRGAIVGLCPTTEANLGDGIFPAEAFEQVGGRWGIGSDSHISVCPFDELRTLEYSQRLHSRRRNVLGRAGMATATVMYARAALAGADALDQPAGLLAAGRVADWVELDTSHPICAGRTPEQILSAHVFSPTITRAASVYVDGHRRAVEGQYEGTSVAEAMRRLLRNA